MELSNANIPKGNPATSVIIFDAIALPFLIWCEKLYEDQISKQSWLFSTLERCFTFTAVIFLFIWDKLGRIGRHWMSNR
jgi:hypothetical protein